LLYFHYRACALQAPFWLKPSLMVTLYQRFLEETLNDLKFFENFKSFISYSGDVYYGKSKSIAKKFFKKIKIC